MRRPACQVASAATGKPPNCIADQASSSRVLQEIRTAFPQTIPPSRERSSRSGSAKMSDRDDEHLRHRLGISRRDLMRRGAVVGGTAALLWTVPAIKSLHPETFAQSGSPMHCCCECINKQGHVDNCHTDRDPPPKPVNASTCTNNKPGSLCGRGQRAMLHCGPRPFEPCRAGNKKCTAEVQARRAKLAPQGH
jgi:hypothetical protein